MCGTIQEEPIETKKGGVVACVSMDMSDPTARSLCFACGASWTNEIEGRCPDCGAALVSRERVIREFEGSVRDPDASLPDLSSLDLLCTSTGEDEQRHVRERLAEFDMPYFCFSEEQGRAGDGSPAPITNFYIAGLQIEWARDRWPDFFRGGSTVLLARAAGDVEAMTYRAALEDRDIGYTTSRFTRQYPFTIGETLFFVAEVDVEAARRAIEDACNGEASTISTQEVAGDAVPGSGISGDASRSLQDLRDEPLYKIARPLLFLSAINNFFLGALYLGFSAPIGVSCLFFSAAQAALGRWSRRNPEPAFGWSLLLLILNALAMMGPWLLGAPLPLMLLHVFFPFIAILPTLFSWRRARALLEGSRQGTSSPAGHQDS